MHITKFILAVFASFCFSPAFSQNILTSAANVFFEGQNFNEASFSIELSEYSEEDIINFILTHLGGNLQKTKTSATAFPEFNIINSWDLKSSSVGNLKIFSLKKNNKSLIKIETEKLNYKEIQTLQQALDEVKKLHRTDVPMKQSHSQLSVYLQENEISSEVLVNLLRSFFHPPHRTQIEQYLKLFMSPNKNLSDPTSGFQKLLLDSRYSPSLRDLFDDYLYRQSLEVLGYKNAWEMPLSQAQETLLSSSSPLVASILQNSKLSIVPVLISLFPEDPLSKLIVNSKLIKAEKNVVFQELIISENILLAYKQSVGLLNAVEQYEYFDHDRLLSELSGLEISVIKELRRESMEALVSNKNILFRYFLGNPKTVDREEFEDQETYYDDTRVEFIPAETYGVAPVYIPGESVVFHRRHYHRFNVIGKYNPGLVNYNLQQAFENRWIEYLFWHKYAPKAMPHTLLLADVIQDAKSDQEVLDKLNKAFPNGWILKGIFDFGTEQGIISDKLDVLQELRKYKNSDFEKFKEDLNKDGYFNGMAPDYYIHSMQDHPAFKGWRISQLLKNPNHTIVQTRMKFKYEFRVEVVGGKVLGQGSTIDRWRYTYRYNKDKPYVAPPKWAFERAENFAQMIVDKLPEKLRYMTFGMDIVLTDDGSYLVDANAGGTSNFLFEEYASSVRAVRKRMEEYAQWMREGKINNGMTGEEQMLFLKARFQEWGIDTNVQFPGMYFLKDRIVDQEFNPITPNPNKYKVNKTNPSIQIKPNPNSCSYVFLF